jgi:Conjugal transfer protein TraD
VAGRGLLSPRTGPNRTVPVTLLRELQAAAAALFRTTTAFSRAERPHARFDTRAWMQARRARTRRLIELGGLVQKSGLADQLANEHFPPAEVLARWRAVGRAALSPPHQPNMKPR